MITNQELDEMQARYDAIESGPWAWDGREDDLRVGVALDENNEPCEGYVGDRESIVYAEEICWVSQNDAGLADFIAHSPSDMPRLIAEVRELRALEKHMFVCSECERIEDASHCFMAKNGALVCPWCKIKELEGG